MLHIDKRDICELRGILQNTKKIGYLLSKAKRQVSPASYEILYDITFTYRQELSALGLRKLFSYFFMKHDINSP